MLVLAVLFLFTLSADAAGLRIGPGGGWAAFLKDDGRLQDISGLAATVKLEAPLDRVAIDDSTETWNKSLYFGVPLVSDQDELLVSLDVNYAQRIGDSENWFLVGVGTAFPNKALLASLDTRDVVPSGEEISSALFLGPRVGFFAEVEIGDGTTIPLELVGGYLFHLAGIPDDVERPGILRLEINMPFAP